LLNKLMKSSESFTVQQEHNYKSIVSKILTQIHNVKHPPYFLYIKNIRKIIQKFSKNYSTKDSKESFFDCMQSWLDQERGWK